MDDRETTLRRSYFWRLGFFLRDFLPERNLQLLLPLGTFLLLLGWTYWLWLPAGYPRNAYILSNSIVRLSVRFAYTASIVLWCVSVRKPVRQFVRWVFFPPALGVLIALVIFSLWQRRTESFVESESAIILNRLRSLPTLLTGFRLECFFAIAGLLVFAGCLWAIQAGHLSLPWQFRGVNVGDAEIQTFASSFFTVLVISIVAVALFEFFSSYAVMSATGGPLPISLMFFRWPADFPASEWAQMLFGPAVVAFVAVVIFGKSGEGFSGLRAASKSKGYLWAIAIPLAIATSPRFLVKLGSETMFQLRGIGPNGFPPDWEDLFPLRGLPWIFLVYLAAWLDEFVLRSCLQEHFEKRFGLKRAAILTGLSWWILPLYSGVGPVGLHASIPGFALLVSLAAHLTYNAPLVWLYARTRSIWPVSLMHGTMLLLRVGNAAYTINYRYRALYWVESAVWVLTAWFLFKRFPTREGATAAEPILA